MHGWRRVAAAGVLTASTVFTGAAPGAAGPPVTAPAAGAGPAETEYAFLDHRPRPAGPAATDSRRAPAGLTARFNALGTPAAVSRMDGRPLATGLSRKPDTAARQYLAGNRGLFALDRTAVDALETVAQTRIGGGTVVLLRQRFGTLPAGFEGLAAVTVRDGDVLRVTSSLSAAAGTPAAAQLTAARALEIALDDAGIPADRLAQQRVRLVAMPMPGAAPRAAYQVVVVSDDAHHPLGYTTYVDARDGAVLVRENLIDFADDNPRWKVFAEPPSGDGADTRQTWCAIAVDGCDRAVVDPATGQAWDTDAGTGRPTGTTRGNSAETVVSWGNGHPVASPTSSPNREYTYPFTDQWHQQKCDPAALTSPQRADADAAAANLFAVHNLMHDWSYHLGFTEATWNLQTVNAKPGGLGGDAERGNAMNGAATPDVRNNANQSSTPDGVPPTTNMFMFQPRRGEIYAPCVDGDFDATFIAHEYGHAISNRMIAGPDTRLNSLHGNAMGESWSDLIAMEFLFEHGYAPAGDSPFVTGGYVSGDPVSGVRNYDMSDSPLNFSNVGYDATNSVHSIGEIWSAVNADIRAAMLDRYGAGDRELQESCAAGRTAVDQCPGNRRWIQLVLDSFLLQATGEPSMLDMRDNLLAADQARFDGANADLLWRAFAHRGFGADAASGPGDLDPTPSFRSPAGDNVEVTLRPTGAGQDRPVALYVGDYEARSVPVADTDPATALPDTVSMVPGDYRFLAVGKGLGHTRLTGTVSADNATVSPEMHRNVASGTNGAVAAGGTGATALRADLLDDDEDTFYMSGLLLPQPVAQPYVTVDLAGTAAQVVTRVQVGSAQVSGQRFDALRSFRVEACDATAGADCATDAGYRVAYTSPADAFPGGTFRPKMPDFTTRSFALEPTPATHLRIRSLTSQCSGNPHYTAESDNDPRTSTVCANNNASNWNEFQAFTD